MADSDVHHLMKQPWWGRVWVLQELVLSVSSLFICGDRSIASQRLVLVLKFLDTVSTYASWHSAFGLKRFGMKAADVLKHHDHVFRHPAVRLFRARRRAWSQRWTLDFVLSQINTSESFADAKVLQSSEPVDQIYGILGLVDTWPEGREPIMPDYSVSFMEVFARAAVELLETYPSQVFTLLRVSTYPKTVVGLASWIPDFTMTWRGAMKLSIIPRCDKRIVNLSYRMAEEGRDLLDLPGYMCGLIEGFSIPPELPRLEKGEKLRHFHVWQNYSRKIVAWINDLFAVFWQKKRGRKNEPYNASSRDEGDLLAFFLADTHGRCLIMACLQGLRSPIYRFAFHPLWNVSVMGEHREAESANLRRIVRSLKRQKTPTTNIKTRVLRIYAQEK